MLAAVVSHFVSIPIFIIAPAPRNHIPETTWAAILPGSLIFELYISGTIIESIIKRQEPTQMSIWVLIPAGCLLSSLSSHNTKAITKVIRRRNKISDCDIISISIWKVLYMNSNTLLFFTQKTKIHIQWTLSFTTNIHSLQETYILVFISPSFFIFNC